MWCGYMVKFITHVVVGKPFACLQYRVSSRSFLHIVCSVLNVSLHYHMFCRYKASSVAVKIIQPASTTEEYAKRREKFLREIMMLSRVQHENLVKVFFFV